MPIVAPLVELGILALVLWTVAAALAIALIMKEVGAIFRHIPVVGGYIAGAVESVAQGISNVAGKLEHGVDKLIGASWHLLARYMDHLWHNIESQAATLLHVAELVARLVHAHALLRAIVHPLTKAWHGIEHGVRDLRREAHQLAHRVKVLEREITKGIGHDLRIHVKALEQELGRVERRVIPSIRSIAQGAEHDVAALRKWVEDNALVAGTAAFAGAVAWALSRLGLGGLRCSSLRNNLDKRGCSMWGAMDDLLGLLALGIAAGEFEELVREAQSLTNVATTVFDDVFGLSR